LTEQSGKKREKLNEGKEEVSQSREPNKERKVRFRYRRRWDRDSLIIILPFPLPVRFRGFDPTPDELD